MSAMVVGIRAMTMAAAEMAMAVPATPRLPHEVVKPEEDERTPRDPREDVARPLARLDSQPDYQNTEQGSEKDMARAAQGDHHERLGLAPSLTAASKHKRRPVCWNRCMVKSNDEAGRGNG